MAFARDFGWWPLVSGSYTGLLVATQIEYVAELWNDRPVQVTTAVETLGRTSYTLVQKIEQDGAGRRARALDLRSSRAAGDRGIVG